MHSLQAFINTTYKRTRAVWSQRGHTALIMATGRQHTAIVEMLLEAGARRDLYDKVSPPPLLQSLR
jgi:DNA-binding NarL/FixJ family response regulator